MATVEQKILGDDPKGRAAQRMDSKRPVISLENSAIANIKGMPHLFLGDDRVRFHPFTGELYVSRYRDTESGPKQGFPRFSDMEGAMGYTTHLMASYHPESGDVVKRTARLHEFVVEKLNAFGSNSVTDDDLDLFRAETEQRLGELGFSTAIKPNKVLIDKQVRKGVGPDNLARRNPLVSRSRLASALLKLYMEGQFEDRVMQKYTELFFMLLGEYQYERAYTEGVLTELQDPNSELEMLQATGEMISSRMPVKIAPFRIPVMQAHVAIFADKKRLLPVQHGKYFENAPDLWRRLHEIGNHIDDVRPTLIENLQDAIQSDSNVYAPSV